jgi:hypothetical protein
LNDYENALLNSVSSFTKKSLFLMNSGRRWTGKEIKNRKTGKEKIGREIQRWIVCIQQLTFSAFFSISPQPENENFNVVFFSKENALWLARRLNITKEFN